MHSKEVIRKTLTDFSKAWLDAGLFFVLLLSFPLSTNAAFANHSELPAAVSSSVGSAIDARFKYQRAQILMNAEKFSQPKNPAQPKSPGVTFYQSVLRSTLNSECVYFPSDSAYAQLLAKHCSPVKTMLKSFSRFSLEPDAAQLGRPLVKLENKIHFEDIPDNCNWLD